LKEKDKEVIGTQGIAIITDIPSSSLSNYSTPTSTSSRQHPTDSPPNDLTAAGDPNYWVFPYCQGLRRVLLCFIITFF